jgi:hypothetical protein
LPRRVYTKVTEIGDRRGSAERRRKLLAGLSGRILEIGRCRCELAHYPGSVSEVLAVEPEPYLREQARRAAAAASVEIQVVDGEADRLPGEDGSFDAGSGARYDRWGRAGRVCYRGVRALPVQSSPLLHADPHILGVARRP